jgi:hypothetical protein
VAAGTAALIVLAACEASAPRDRGPEARRDARSQAAERAPTHLPVRVENSARGAARAVVGRAVADLKRLGFWERLTSHLYHLRLGTRLGVANVPDDKHLADAYLTAEIDEHGSGALCDILFFPAAIKQDLARQKRFRSEGLLPDDPPTLRQFWVSILGHELGHCLPDDSSFRQRGERTAERWEGRVLAAARSSI